jgi:hypothetical protein
MPPHRKSSDALQLQDRDFNLLRGLFECRVMTASHIATLYFDGSREAAKKRLQKLKAAGLITERKRHINEPSILFLTRKSFALLQAKGALAGYPPLGGISFERRARVSEMTLRHELEIMDVKAAFHSAIRKAAALAIAEFSTWPKLYEFCATPSTQAAEILMQPDGFIRIHEKGDGADKFEHAFFLEVDRSHEVQDKLAAKAACYFDYFKSGGFAVRNSATRSDFKKFPFRVLMILKTAERRNNTAERLLQNNPPILTQVYLSTFEEVIANPLGAVWIRPIDYRNATDGTPFETGKRREKRGYKSQPAREIFVETKIKKQLLLADPE